LKISRYFTNLAQSYLEEIDDLVTDSEGKSVLQRRLQDKRSEMDALLAMIDYSPEMVAVIFYDAFGFESAEVMQKLLQSEPELGDFLKWDVLRKSLSIAPWAEPLIATTLTAASGDAFLVTAATLEFVRTRAAFMASKSEAADESDDDEDAEDEADDLGDAGSDWLVEQGFDTREE